MRNFTSDGLSFIRQWRQPLFLKLYGPPVVLFAVLGVWLAVDLQQSYETVITDTSHRAMQRSLIISQSFRSKVLASNYVLRDVLGRIQKSDLVYPDIDPDHAERMAKLLKEKADTVPDFFSMVIFDQDCVFTATATRKNTGVKSKPELCEARKAHTGSGPLVSYVPGTKSASGRSVLVLSHHLKSPTNDFLGGVLGVIELNRAQQLFDLPGLDPDDSVALLDDDKVLLARYPLLPEAIEKRATALVIPMELHSTDSDLAPSVPIQIDLDYRQRIFGFSKIEGFPFIVAFGFDKARAIENWQQRAVELTAGYLIMLILSLLVTRSQSTMLRQREDLRSSEEHFRMLAENMADIVWKADAQMRFTYINTADQQVRGFNREEVIGTYIGDHLTQQGKDILEAIVRERRELEMSTMQGIALKYDLAMLHKNGNEIWIEMSSVPIYSSDGYINGYQGIGRDVSARRQHETTLLQLHQRLETQLQVVVNEKSALQELAARDPLTGLYNRRSLDAVFPREIARAKRDDKLIAVVMIDLDHFKRVNDQYGHAAGDDVIMALAELLKKGVRESDLICRYGGEEFVAIMPSMSLNQALERVECWRKQLEAMRVISGDFRISITLSAGIAIFPHHGKTADLLLNRADEMLYKSKLEGRNRITVYMPT